MSVDDLNYILVYPERMQLSVFGIYANHVHTTCTNFGHSF